MWFNDVVKNSNKPFCHVVDPINAPDDDPKYPAILETYEVAVDYGNDAIRPDEEHWLFTLWRKHGPLWAKYPVNPTNRTLWSIVRGPLDGYDKRLDHYRRNIKKVELGMYEGHERIIIEQKPIADYCAYFIRACAYTHYYAMNYGVATMLFAWRYPTKPWIWLTLCYISFVNAYSHSRFLRCDRFHRYNMCFPEEWYDLCVDNDFLLENFPDNYHPYHIPKAVWLLKRVNRLRSMVGYVKHQSVACTAAFFVSFRMWQWEEEIIGSTSRTILHWPVINRCDYFLPNFLNMDNQWMHYIPRDMKTFLGMTFDVWAFLVLFGFRAYDLVTHKMPEYRTVSQRDLNKWRRHLKGL